jgi:hypothetical protein
LSKTFKSRKEWWIKKDFRDFIIHSWAAEENSRNQE